MHLIEQVGRRTADGNPEDPLAFFRGFALAVGIVVVGWMWGVGLVAWALTTGGHGK